jgi:hypothetical protein
MGLRSASPTIAVKMIPVLAGTALRNKGIHPLLDAVIDYLPSPMDVPPIVGHLPLHDETHIERCASDAEPFSALAFKVATDPYVGRLTFFRVYSGSLKSGSYVYNSTKDKRERIGRLLQMHANKRDEIEEVLAGDIAAAIGLKDTRTGDTLSDEVKQKVRDEFTGWGWTQSITVDNFLTTREPAKGHYYDERRLLINLITAINNHGTPGLTIHPAYGKVRPLTKTEETNLKTMIDRLGTYVQDIVNTTKYDTKLANVATTATVPLADIGAALDDLASGTSAHSKVLVDPRVPA